MSKMSQDSSHGDFVNVSFRVSDYVNVGYLLNIYFNKFIFDTLNT